MDYQIYAKRSVSKKTGNPYWAVVIDYGYKKKLACVGDTDVAEFLGLPVAGLYSLKSDLIDCGHIRFEVK